MAKGGAAELRFNLPLPLPFVSVKASTSLTGFPMRRVSGGPKAPDFVGFADPLSAIYIDVIANSL
jgi:hypothetical protein